MPGAVKYGWLTDVLLQVGVVVAMLRCHDRREIGARCQDIVNGDPTLEQIAQGDGLALCAAGAWTAAIAPDLEQIVADAEKLAGSRPNIFIDVSQVSKLDTFGAWLIERLRRSLTAGRRRGEDRRPVGQLFAAWSTRCAASRPTPRVDAGARDAHRHAGPDRPQRGRRRRAPLLGLIDMLGAVLAAGWRVLIRAAPASA